MNKFNIGNKVRCIKFKDYARGTIIGVTNEPEEMYHIRLDEYIEGVKRVWQIVDFLEIIESDTI